MDTNPAREPLTYTHFLTLMLCLLEGLKRIFRTDKLNASNKLFLGKLPTK